MPYATIIVSKPEHSEKVRHIVVAPLGDEIVTWHRTTNGRQGRGNAWVKGDIPTQELRSDEMYGEPVSIPVSQRDVMDYQKTGTPSTLFTKLVRQAPVTPSIEPHDLVSTVANVIDFATNDPDSLKQYYIENRVVLQRVNETFSESSAGFIPSMQSMEHYIERSWFGVSETEIYDFALKYHLNVSNEGDAGTGKTSSAMAYAAKRGMKFYSVSCNAALEPTQLFGTYVPDGRGGFVWQYGGLAEIVKSGGVILFNEITFAPPRIATAVMSLLDYRRQITLMDHGNEIIDAHPDLLIIADYNPNYRGTTLMNEAFKDRFEIKMRYEYDTDIERKILASESLLDLAKRMRHASTGSVVATSSSLAAFDTPISTRILKTFEKVAKGLSFDLAVEIFINNFSDEERSSVRMLLDGMKYNIQTELGLLEIPEQEEVVV